MKRGFFVVSAIALAAAFVVSTLSFAPPASAQQQGESAIKRIQDTKKVRFGWASWWPYAYRDPKANNELAGAAVDLLKLMAEQLKAEPVWIEDSWATIVAGLQSSKYDVALPMGVTLDRALAGTFTEPFMQFGSGIVIRKEDAAKFKSWQDLDKSGLKIVVGLGSTGDIFASKKFTKGEVVRLRTEPELLMSLITKKADAWHSTYGAFHKILPDQPQLMIMPATTLAITPMSFAVRQGDFHFAKWIDYFVAEIKQTGELVRVLDKHGLGEAYLIGSSIDQAAVIPPSQKN